jgi:hypothetical protein
LLRRHRRAISFYGYTQLYQRKRDSSKSAHQSLRTRKHGNLGENQVNPAIQGDMAQKNTLRLFSHRVFS